jgi:hypothetical protein
MVASSSPDVSHHVWKARRVSSTGLTYPPQQQVARNLHPRCRLICLARKSNLAAPHAAKQHDGQITKTCPDLLLKIFRFRCRANQWFDSGRLTR